MAYSTFSLAWDSFTNNICQGFCSLQQNGEFVDMTLAADGHLVKVHQAVIALASPYLKQLITSAPCPHPVIHLNNISNATLQLLLEYVYTGEVLVTPSDLDSFIAAAKSLSIKGLENINQADLDTEENVTNIHEPEFIPPKRKKPNDISDKTPRNTISDFQPVEVQQPLETYDEEVDHLEENDEENNDSTDITIPEFVDKNSKVDGTTDVLSSSSIHYTISTQGSLQVILNRFIYYLYSKQASGIQKWRCVDYKNRAIDCKALLVTKNNIILNRVNPHNHAFHDKKILQKIEKNVVYSALNEVDVIEKDFATSG